MLKGVGPASPDSLAGSRNCKDFIFPFAAQWSRFPRPTRRAPAVQGADLTFHRCPENVKKMEKQKRPRGAGCLPVKKNSPQPCPMA
ncbi:hypothetical protein NDU88_007981 [Pleurodeles waltl]|uniref:Uncharacterized protein n=1 Tax=Pleurodeles waltl TaxID=8319 RepID=A0AAV7VR90_PLEWA|nr:hypothetical protein NDU88_007981 [Pleurodeles waltl]